MSHEEGKFGKMEAENVKEILGFVSSEISAMIKSILSSVFSEEAGRNMGQSCGGVLQGTKGMRLA